MPAWLNLATCEFAKATVGYLGEVVGQGNVQPLQAKVTVIEHYPVPTTERSSSGSSVLWATIYYPSFC